MRSARNGVSVRTNRFDSCTLRTLVFCAHSLTDRTLGSGPKDGGSIPPGRTKFLGEVA